MGATEYTHVRSQRSGVSGSANAAATCSMARAMAISVSRTEAVLKHFQARMPHGLGVPDVKPDTDP